MLHSLAMFLRWKKAVFATYEICFSKDRLQSNITPRSFTESDKVTGHPNMLKLCCERFCGRFLEPISISSVLFGFNKRKLRVSVFS